MDAADMLATGAAVLLDVRPASDFEASHPQGATSVPLFRVMELATSAGGGVGKLLKFAACMANGVQPTGEGAWPPRNPVLRCLGRRRRELAQRARGASRRVLDPAELDPGFVEGVRAAAASGKKVLFACESGGSLSPTVNFSTGKASRSLKAAWKAASEGAVDYGQILHVELGVLGWYQSGLPMRGEGDFNAAAARGKTPNAAPTPRP